MQFPEYVFEYATIKQIYYNRISIKEDPNTKKWIGSLRQYLQKRHLQKRIQFQKTIKARTICSSINLGGMSNFQHQQLINFKQTITLLFSHFAFLNITTLDLGNSNISNCGFINFIQIPFLEEFSMSHNKITNFKPLIKMNFPRQLDMLDLGFNLGLQIKLQRCNLSKHMEQNVAIYLRSQHQIVNQDLSLLAKIETGQKLLTILPDQQVLDPQPRIQQQKVGKVLWRKFYGNEKYVPQSQEQQVQLHLQEKQAEENQQE